MDIGSSLPARELMLRQLARYLAAHQCSHPLRVAIDGVDAAGKTTLADELAELLRVYDRSVIRASIDGFHHPRAIRYRSGPLSPIGYYQDSFDYSMLRSVLLDPLGPDGSLDYCIHAFDLRTDSPVQASILHAAPASILLFDGIFLLCPELCHYWDVHIFVDVPFEISVERGVRRDEVLFGRATETRERYRLRYVPGQRLYLAQCQPRAHADIVVENSDPLHPVLRVFRRHISRVSHLGTDSGAPAL